MPKPPNKPAPQPTTFTPDHHLPNFTIGYWCPECLTPVPNPNKVSRPPIWHEACKPASYTIGRYKRICPGCGLMHVLEPGTSSAYDTEACKARYKTALGTAKKEAKVCIICGDANDGGRKARRIGLCTLHVRQHSQLTAIRSERGLQVYSDNEALNLLLAPETIPPALQQMLASLNPDTPRTTQAQPQEARGLYIPPSTIYPVDDDEVDWS